MRISYFLSVPDFSSVTTLLRCSYSLVSFSISAHLIRRLLKQRTYVWVNGILFFNDGELINMFIQIVGYLSGPLFFVDNKIVIKIVKLGHLFK